MKYIPGISSFKDLILWPLRFFTNLPIQTQAAIGLIVTVPMILAIVWSDKGTTDAQSTKADKTGYMRTGCIESNIDSIKIRKGETIRLLARQGSLIWAETANGKNRGFIKGKDIFNNPDEFTLPSRRSLSSYYISQKKFETLISDPATTLSSLQKDYINAEYLRLSGKKLIGEFGFHVIDSTGRQLRPIITFSPDESVADYRLEFWRKSRGFIHDRGIDFLSPIISTREFQSFSPYDRWYTNLLWTYLVGYIPLFLFIVILWLRYPLIWLPNTLANLIVYLLIIGGPLLWCSMLRIQGVAWWPVVPVAILFSIVNCLMFWGLYSRLRCPRCKSLIYHEHSKTTTGREYVEVSTSHQEIAREHLEHTNAGYWKNELVKIGDKYEKRGTLEHRYVDKVTYRIYETRSLIQPLTKQYACPRCGHGKDEKSQKVLESHTTPKGTCTKIERYTKKQISGLPFDGN